MISCRGCDSDVFMFVEDGSELEIKERADHDTASAPVGKEQIADAPSGTASVPLQKSTESAGARTLSRESSVRVPAGRLDRLVNLVGELVMNQSRLTQIMTQVGAPEL